MLRPEMATSLQLIMGPAKRAQVLDLGVPALAQGSRVIKFEERPGHLDTHNVQPQILRSGVAAAVAEKSGHRRSGTGRQGTSHHIQVGDSLPAMHAYSLG